MSEFELALIKTFELIKVIYEEDIKEELKLEFEVSFIDDLKKLSKTAVSSGILNFSSSTNDTIIFDILSKGNEKFPFVLLLTAYL